MLMEFFFSETYIGRTTGEKEEREREVEGRWVGGVEFCMLVGRRAGMMSPVAIKNQCQWKWLKA